MRPSSKLDTNAPSPCRVQEPPPYSCTRVRTLKPFGVTSSPSLTTAARPPSEGRRSSHQTAPSSPRSGSASLTPSRATSAALKGERHDPYGAVVTPRTLPEWGHGLASH